jgi:hypothetical protein
MGQNGFPGERLKRAVAWYAKNGDEFSGEEELLKISLAELHGIFSPAGDDDPQLIYTYPMAEREAAALQPRLTHRIDLAGFDYFLEATAVASLPKEER